ncbi:dienelactone hydrolase family protein [Maribacter sp. 2210JD10-5]|uniref:carboxylesterase family protein n=1 Tax=Maribacter sp. 2210JD10-5 TaxID=3386272 RepID=UPI0039BD72E0
MFLKNNVLKSTLNVILKIFLFVVIQSCASQTGINLIDDELQTNVVENLRYYLYFPKEYSSENTKEYGILLFLHGGGEAGSELNTLKSSGPPKMIADGHEFPFLILAPQNPNSKKWWNTRAVKQLLDSVIADNRVDKERVYITGLSRGGGAAWEMAVQYPDTFAAMAVVCGMTPLPYASWINKEMPIWVFHGEQDESIPFSESETMVEKLEAMGYDVRFTRYPQTGHNSWTKAYKTDGLFDWFNEQRLRSDKE